MKFLLDTNILIALLAPKRGAMLGRKVAACNQLDIATSVIVAHELYYGACRSAWRHDNIRRLRLLLEDIEPLTISLDDAQVAGEVWARQQAIGKPIGPYDTLIAGQAISRGLVLVTNNTREFSRVEGLEVVDWLKD